MTINTRFFYAFDNIKFELGIQNLGKLVGMLMFYSYFWGKQILFQRFCFITYFNIIYLRYNDDVEVFNTLKKHSIKNNIIYLTGGK